MAKVFFSYSHADEALRDQLEKQLSERHRAGEAIVIPVILRACDWHGAPFGELNATPPDGKPVTQYPDRDQALYEVAKAVRAAAERLRSKAPSPQLQAAQRRSPRPAAPALPRSSNLRLAKRFTERDRDHFKLESFEFMTKFFENSLSELSQRNTGIDGVFRRIDANRFSAIIYRNGRAVSRCTVFIGDRLVAGGIAYSSSETTGNNSYNENLTVEADDQAVPAQHGNGDAAPRS